MQNLCRLHRRRWYGQLASLMNESLPFFVFFATYTDSIHGRTLSQYVIIRRSGGHLKILVIVTLEW